MPTGFASLPPVGPAIPVILTATSAPLISDAPLTIASATCDDTAPYCSNNSKGTPSCETFNSFVYVTQPPRNHPLAPATSEIKLESKPPVQDSAVAIV